MRIEFPLFDDSVTFSRFFFTLFSFCSVILVSAFESLFALLFLIAVIIPLMRNKDQR